MARTGRTTGKVCRVLEPKCVEFWSKKIRIAANTTTTSQQHGYGMSAASMITNETALEKPVASFGKAHASMRR